MSLTLLLGGARSGKSALAVRRAGEWRGDVAFVVTARAGDREMAERIARHRAERRASWSTVEEPIALARALWSAPAGALVVVDCLTLWISNLIARGDSDGTIDRLAGEAARTAAARGAPTIAVSNEVGMGLVPASRLGRRFRETLGRTNAAWAAAADDVGLVVAGRMLVLGAGDHG